MLEDTEKVRKDLAATYGQVWDYQELRHEFDVLRIEGDRTLVIRKSDRRRGSVQFVPQPPLYFGFEPSASD